MLRPPGAADRGRTAQQPVSRQGREDRQEGGRLWSAAASEARRRFGSGTGQPEQPSYGFHGWHGFGMGSGQPKRCGGHWPCHRSPKGTAGTGGGEQTTKVAKSAKNRDRRESAIFRRGKLRLARFYGLALECGGKTPLWIGIQQQLRITRITRIPTSWRVGTDGGGEGGGRFHHREPQRGKAATKLIRTHELMKMERGISRKTGNAGKQDRLRAIPEMN